MKAVRIMLLSACLITCTGLLSSFSYMSLSMQGTFPMPIEATQTTEPQKVCVVDDPEISEASGLAISRRDENAVWIHNDSGDEARLFLVGMDGKTRAIVLLNVERPADWEDMCSFEFEGERWLLIADTGDNQRIRSRSAPACELLLIKEPEVRADDDKNASRPTTIRVDVVARIAFQYPDGPEDCESLAVDTQRKEILLLTKTDPFRCRLFKLPLSLVSGRRQLKAEAVANVAVPFATSMDVSADGRKLAIVNMFSGALLQREPTESWSEACQNPITVLTLPTQPQCETVCFNADATSLFVNSERTGQPLWRISLTPDAAD